MNPAFLPRNTLSEFHSWNDRTSPPIVRLQTNGAIDSSFVASIGSPAGGAYIEAIEPLTNGRVYIGGFFQAVGGRLRNGIARLNANGSADMNFAPPIDPRAYDTNGNYMFLTHCIQPLRNGQVLVGGEFSRDFPRHGLVRFNADGSIDPAFNAPFEVESYAVGILEQADGRLLVAGLFVTDGFYYEGVKRLFPNGSLDESFGSANVEGLTAIMVIDNSGGVVVGGNFDRIGGTERFNLARLLTSVTTILRIERITPDAVRVSWPAEFGNLVVEQSANLGAGGWSILNPSGLNANRFAVTNGVSQAPRYYRAEFQ